MLGSTIAATSCSCVSGSVTSFSLIGSKRALLHQIKTGKQKDPNQVDEVPVQADHFDAIGVPLPLRGPHLVAEEEEVAEHDHAADDMQAVQAGEREVDGHEVVRGRGAPLLKLVRVLEAFDDQEAEGAEQRQGDEDAPLLQIAQAQIRPG